jgi:hypothetical protein
MYAWHENIGKVIGILLAVALWNTAAAPVQCDAETLLLFDVCSCAGF